MRMLVCCEYMNAIKYSLVLLLGGVTGLWFMADNLSPDPFNYFAFRAVLVQYSGVLAIAVMSVAMVLAVRPKWLERYLDGLDKMYRLHKWLGISALVLAVVHWWFAQGTRWMVGWGWLVRPERRSRGPQEVIPGLEGWLGEQRGLAESVGEWAFYFAALLMVLALVKYFPYHLFKKTHKWIALGYLALIFHSFVLVKFEYWSQPVGWLVALLLVAGTFSAVWILLGQTGRSRKVSGNIASVTEYPALKVLETVIQLHDGWAGHKAGQFAFVTSDHKEGAHPFTIASAWHAEQPGLTIISKALGDHTARLREQLKPGMPVTVEGPYGCFDFEDSPPRQIWIGAGIGITPFIARLKQLATEPGDKQIDLFHSTREFDEAAINKLKADAAAAGVQLHVLVSGQDGRLSADLIRREVSQWQQASVWFCGPGSFGQALKADFKVAGLPLGHFHQELFEMR